MFKYDFFSFFVMMLLEMMNDHVYENLFVMLMFANLQKEYSQMMMHQLKQKQELVKQIAVLVVMAFMS